MTVLLGLGLLVLGLAIGFIVAWAFGVGASLGLVVGVLLVIAGAIVGFISEWLIDEAYRKNRELRRQLLGERANITLGVTATADQVASDLASEKLAAMLQRRDEELHELREQLVAATGRLNELRDEFDAYQRTHPDDLTVIKGIGPVYQWKLRDAGFNTFKQLATADPEQMRRMLDIKDWQRVDVASWITQARDWAQRG